MPKFTFDVEVTGGVEGWEVALEIKDAVNEKHRTYHPNTTKFHIERVTDLDPDACVHGDNCAQCIEDEIG